jgi:hypothetical protein
LYDVLVSDVVNLSCWQAKHAQHLPGKVEVDDLRFGYIMMKLNISLIEPKGPDGLAWHYPFSTCPFILIRSSSISESGSRYIKK